MDLGLPDKVSETELMKDYLLLTKRNYREFTFNGSLESGKNDLIRFHFGKQMNYEVFIRILDILTIEKTPTYMPYNNKLFIVNGAPSDIERERKKREAKYGKQTRMPCGNPALEARQRAFEEEQQRLLNNENFQKSFFKSHRFLYLALFGIILMNVFMLIKFNKNRIYNQKTYI